MRRWIECGLGLVVAFLSAQASAADPGPLNDAQLKAFVRTQAISTRCQKALPGLKPQLLDAHANWVSMLDASQRQAAEAYAGSKDGKKLAKSTDAEASSAFGRNVISAAENCIGLLKKFNVVYPAPPDTAMPADSVKWHQANFAPMVLAALKCARLDGVDAAPAPDGAETWSYRGCGRVETMRVAPDGRLWSMDPASANRLFAAMVD